MAQDISPAKQLETFMGFVDEAKLLYDLAQSNLKQEEQRKIDLEHEIEFSANDGECCKAARKFKRCRRARRTCKDMIKRYEQIVIFFQEPQHQKTLNQLRQLLGRQRREEEFLNSDRTYKPRT